MFYLSLITHTLRLPPHLLDLPLAQALKSELEKLFLDKIIPKLGLCISIYDIQSIDGGFVFPSDGASTYTVTYRLIMFRPFVGEIISAKVESLDATGLRLTLGFFNDILVPANLLPTVSTYDDDGRWTWKYSQGEGEEPVELYIEEDDEIRFKVHSVKYPAIPNDRENEVVGAFAPMVITASIDADGLGPVSWWV